MRYHNITKDDMLNGDGLRVVLWVSGCSHCCKKCHNPITWDPNYGLLFDESAKQEIFDQLDKPYISGITFSGGDPLYQVDSVLELVKYSKSIGLNVWLYTGFTYEELKVMIKKNPKLKELLMNVDALVDGKFLIEEKSFDIKFRGSKNQRIIDIKKSIESNKLVLIDKYIYREPKYISYRENNHLYI